MDGRAVYFGFCWGVLVVVEKEILISVEVGDLTMIYSVYLRG